MSDRLRLARAVYAAFASGDREALEGLVAADFSFHAPPDPQLTAPATSSAAGRMPI